MALIISILLFYPYLYILSVLTEGDLIMRKRLTALLLTLCTVISAAGCSLLPGTNPAGSLGETDGNDGSAFTAGSGDTTIRILSGSENQELEDIVSDCADKAGVRIEMDYQGSVDIMRELQSGAEDYDAVWPASSMWLSLGDSQHLVKHSQSVSLTPVVFGIRQSLAGELGFTDGDVSVTDILTAISDSKMTFCMTSATQSNSGASAYIGFLYALLGKQEGLTSEDLQSDDLKTQIRELLSGVDRSSGSSDWLKDMFLAGDYDAMVNYECLVIDANEQLTAEGKEPLYVVYPYDGLSIADSPLGYVDHDDDQKEEAFLAFQEKIMSADSQSSIEATGRRITANGVSEENKNIFNADWGIDTERILSPIQMPEADVLMDALNIYQTEFKKPSLNIYCLDFSGSMTGEGEDQLKEAMSQILIQENAEKNLLQASEGEVNIAVLFDDEIVDVLQASDDSDAALEELYNEIAAAQPGGGTDIYTAAAEAYSLASGYDLSLYTPAVILMTDGQSVYNESVFEDALEACDSDIPVFSITFGDADHSQLEDLAALTDARVFDGTKDLTEAFRSVKGYN